MFKFNINSNNLRLDIVEKYKKYSFLFSFLTGSSSLCSNLVVFVTHSWKTQPEDNFNGYSYACKARGF